MRTVLEVAAVFFTVGGALAIGLVHGAHRLRDDCAPPILRTSPRPTDWTNQEHVG